jgi:hypothetical protein
MAYYSISVGVACCSDVCLVEVARYLAFSCLYSDSRRSWRLRLLFREAELYVAILACCCCAILHGVFAFASLNNIAGDSNYTGWGLYFGEGQTVAVQANWNLVSLTATPEPSAMSLILLGSGVFIYARRICKKN